MKIMTIRGVDEELAAHLKRAAKKESLSVNQFIVNLLKKHFGQIKEKRFTRKYDDLDSVFGQWSKEDYKAISRELEAQRKIDKDMW